jgi:hypothetical protein
MAITKTTPTKKSAVAETMEKPVMSKPATPEKAATRTAAERSIRIEDTAHEIIEKAKANEPVLAAPERRQQMIREAAYLRAASRGFTGDPVQDWMEAEAEIDLGLSENPESTRSK